MQKRQDAVVNGSTGHPVQGATVTVTTILGVAATLYTADGSGLISGNSVTTDSNGRYFYYAADGRYTETIAGDGITTTIITDILLEDPVDGSSALAASGGSALVGFLPSGTGAIANTVQGKLRQHVCVLDFVPVALHAGIQARTETSDISTYIQAAIDYVNGLGGGVVWFPTGTYYCNIIVKEGVTIDGGGAAYGYLPSSVGGVRLIAAATGVVVDTPSGSTLSVGVVGMNVGGLGAGTAAKGIRFRNVTYGAIRRVCVNNFADEGILVSAGVAPVLEDVLAVNCVLNRTRGAKTGAVDIAGTDPIVSRVEATCSQSALSDANAYCCGVVIRSANGFFDTVIGEISDEGIHIISSASLNRFVNCRADLNFGHGWLVIGTSNQFSNCLGLNNSQETTNTYDNWQFTSSSGTNQTDNCQATSNVAKVAKYGFNDLVSSATAKNRHVNPFSAGAGTAQYLNTSAGSAMDFPEGPPVAFTALDTTPSVAGGKNFQTANSGGATTITAFDDAVSGQHFFVLAADSNTTFQHNGAGLTLPAATNITAVIQTIYHFVKTGGTTRIVGGA